ncbi:MAG: MBL fold metallo-hydrolase, partial [Methanomicrobiales archaeon]|nr:MBL fold metallo-hydrolase [Methanomicrobiales archaeon]
MEIQNLTSQSTIYTSNAWFCSCEEDGISGILIDSGCDPAILKQLHEIKLKAGRNPVKKIILTHSHYDHARLVKEIKEEYHAAVYASSPYTAEVDKVLIDGDVITCGRYHFEIVSIPGH